jgi:hypothetical protein
MRTNSYFLSRTSRGRRTQKSQSYFGREFRTNTYSDSVEQTERDFRVQRLGFFFPRFHLRFQTYDVVFGGTVSWSVTFFGKMKMLTPPGFVSRSPHIALSNTLRTLGFDCAFPRELYSGAFRPRVLEMAHCH